ncbi:hypothetical protein KEH51_05560 [[Brevibacterium] frigoritolerans]|uniref:Uncharacterized protein n=1 Tax=Peribacillus frigoritolerans TaxID=450367 RepID=A0A941JA07_9BACI|nr:hypothetical protein [Peribacillus frigoritolerans]
MGIVITVLAAAGYWYPPLAIITVVLAILCREFLHHSQRQWIKSFLFIFRKVSWVSRS